MNNATLKKKAAVAPLLLAVALSGFLAPAVWAQGSEVEALIQRLSQLEQRQAILETENQRLRDRLEKLETAGAVVAGRPAGQPAPAETPPQRVQFGGQIRFRPESRSSFNEQTALNNVVLQRIRLDSRIRLNENLSALIQLQDSRLWGQEASTASNESNIDLHQAYLQIDRIAQSGLSLRLGRQELSYGNQRLVGAFGWDNIGRSFDGLKLSYAAASWASDFLFSRVADRRNSRRGDGSQDLIGMYARIGGSGSSAGLEPYALYLRDGAEIAGETAAAVPESTRILTLGFRHFAALQNGLGYDLETAFQVGQRGPDTHRASAVAVQGRYRSKVRFAPEIGFEYDFASGDGKPQDGRSEEFHNLFPTNHLHYGFADFMGWRNMHDFKARFAIQPRPGVRAEISYHRLLLAEKRGAWKNAGGAVLGLDPTGALGRDLGHEVDLILTFSLQEHVRLLPGYSLFLPGEFARGTQGPRASQFGYLQTLVTF